MRDRQLSLKLKNQQLTTSFCKLVRIAKEACRGKEKKTVTISDLFRLLCVKN
jgi:hypothetical protein